MELATQLVLPCTDLDAALSFYTESLQFRLELIMPADSPRFAVLTGYGIQLRLELVEQLQISSPAIRLRLWDKDTENFKPLKAPDGVEIEWLVANATTTIPESTQEFIISRAHTRDSWQAGRAGMLYRDLIPDRLGGKYIASLIRIPIGGPVPDYVHYHQVGFQLIYCKAGWVKVIYEDQGPAFVMQAGDCVLQPPTIRHQVLESSDGLDVIEIGCPAEHETFRDHDLELPTPTIDATRLFGGQHFVRFIASTAPWIDAETYRYQDTGIKAATFNHANVRVLNVEEGSTSIFDHQQDFLFLFVLNGQLLLNSATLGASLLVNGDSVCIPKNTQYTLTAKQTSTILEVSVTE